MTLTFADTHNMVAYLNKFDASDGFNQIIDFLNGSYIAYALTVNPTIYVSCIKQFWNTVAVKQSNDVTRLQALVDKKKVVVTEATIRDALHLDDAEGVDFLPNEEIFTTLDRMGYEKPSTKLTFYKAFFSRVETPLFEGMLVAREPKNQGDAEEQGAVEEHGHDNTAAEELVTAVDDVADQSIQSPTPLTPPPKQPQDIPSTSQVQSPPPQQQSPPPAQPHGGSRSRDYKAKNKVKNLERANKVKTMKLRRLRKVGTSQRIESSDDTLIKDVSNQGMVIDESNKDEGVELMNKKEEKETEDVRVNLDDAQVEGSDAAVVQADVPAAPVNVAAIVTTTPPVKVVVPSTRRRRGVVIRDPEEKSSTKTPIETKSKDKGKAKRKRLNKEAEDVEELKQHLEIVPDEDDDVYTEATPLTRKVPAVDYQIIHVNNKPRYKIIRADDTNQLYRSFIIMLKNFNRDDLETLWNIVKERFSTSKPNNFSNEYLLSTLKTMFGRPDRQDNVWKDQRSVHGQALIKTWKLLTLCGVHIISFTTTQIILLVERRYPLLKFTLEQMLNVEEMVVLQVLNPVEETPMVIVVEEQVLGNIVDEPLVLNEQLVQSMIANELVLHIVVVVEETCRIVNEIFLSSWLVDASEVGVP
nr:xylulose kinase-1 [Tanacetum cinerariifolium]